MPDEDRLVAAIMDLTNQVARVAWALEQGRIAPVPGEFGYEAVPCARCGSQLVLIAEETCSACLEPKKEKSDG